MGYYTSFELQIDHDGGAVIEALSEKMIRFHKNGESLWYSEDRWKWYDHEDELKAVSLQFPLALIAVTGYGEERGDIWRKYFVNGKMQSHKLEIAFPPCDIPRPEWQYATVRVAVLGVDVPVEVRYVGRKTEDELYAMAKDQVRRIL